MKPSKLRSSASRACLLVSIISIPACGSTVGTNDASVDAANDVGAVDAGIDVLEDASPDVPKDGPSEAQADADAGPCNALVNGGTAILTTEKMGTAPTALGGTVTSGLYYLTALNDYDGKTGTTGLSTQTTMNITGTDLEFVEQVGPSTTRASVTFSTANTTFTYNMTCPQIQTYTTGYTATTASLAFYFDDGKGNLLKRSSRANRSVRAS
jgi:hypothetical protein